MNLNPDDGHIMGYDEGWADDDDDIGDEENALLKDYLNQTVWNMPAKYIAIVRHQRGFIDAVKVFVFKNWEQSLSQKFKDMDPGRKIVTVAGPIFSYTAPGVHNIAHDPIFGVGGDLAFNWGYSNNGNRIVVTGSYLLPENIDDDDTRGLGNHFSINPKTNVVGTKSQIFKIAGALAPVPVFKEPTMEQDQLYRPDQYLEIMLFMFQPTQKPFHRMIC